LTDLNRGVELIVTGKTGTREIVGRQPTVKVLERIARRVYGVRNNIIDPFKNVRLQTIMTLYCEQKKRSKTSVLRFNICLSVT
jgi:hypothetical protein